MMPVNKREGEKAIDPQTVELLTSVPQAVSHTAAAAYRSASDIEAHSNFFDTSQEITVPTEINEDILHSDRDALVMECLPLVKYIAYRIANRVPSHVDVEDLINSGIIGLINAAERFEPERNIKFKTYAEQRIRGEILDSLRDLDWVPRTLRRKKKEIEAAFHTIEQQLGRAATDEEIAAHLGISLDEFHKSLDDLKGVTLGTFADNETEDGEGVIATVQDPDAEDPLAKLHENEIRSILKKSIDELPEKERKVVQLYYYGHDMNMKEYYGHDMNMKEIGLVLGITESRVSQLHTKAMLRLRGKLRNYQVDRR
jgi:RNA polymerase sigma factor for flagellar operon FliA